MVTLYQSPNGRYIAIACDADDGGLCQVTEAFCDYWEIFQDVIDLSMHGERWYTHRVESRFFYSWYEIAWYDGTHFTYYDEDFAMRFTHAISVDELIY